MPDVRSVVHVYYDLVYIKLFYSYCLESLFVIYNNNYPVEKRCRTLVLDLSYKRR